MCAASKGNGLKGSKYWLQNFVNDPDLARVLNNKIQEKLPEVGSIEWLSPLKSMGYKEFKVKDIPFDSHPDLTFWPSNGPSWDAIGKGNDGITLLVEAKAHKDETKSKCRASDTNSINLIKKTMKETHDAISPKHTYKESVWYEEFYRLGNRLSFLKKLRQQGLPVVLLLINFIGDYTHHPTTIDSWQKHYDTIFSKMLGKEVDFNNEIIILNIETPLPNKSDDRQ